MYSRTGDEGPTLSSEEGAGCVQAHRGGAVPRSSRARAAYAPVHARGADPLPSRGGTCPGAREGETGAAVPSLPCCRCMGGGRAAPERAHEEGGAASCQWEELLPGFQGEGGGAEDPVFPPPRLCMEMRRRKDAAAFSGKGCSFLAAAEAAAAGAHAAGSHLI